MARVIKRRRSVKDMIRKILLDLFGGSIEDFIKNIIISVNIATSKIQAHADDSSNPAPSVEEYEMFGVTGVTDENLDLVNEAISGADVSTAVKTQAIVDEVIQKKTDALQKISDYAENNTNSQPVLQDYIDAGIAGVTAENLDTVNGEVDEVVGVDADTVEEIETFVQNAVNKIASLAKIELYAEDNTNPVPILEDYANIDTVGVTSENLATVNGNIDAVSGADADTQAKVQGIIDNTLLEILSLKVIEDYAENGAVEPTLQNYIDAGVTGVTAENIASLNGRVDGLQGVDVDTKEEVQALVDLHNAIAVIQEYAENGGTPPTLQNYTDAGVTGVTGSNKSAVNYRVLNSDAVGTDTTAKIQAFADIVDSEIPNIGSFTASSTNFTADGTLTLSVSATDNEAIEKVEFFKNGTLVGSDTSAPYSYSKNITSSDNGTDVYSAVVTDLSGNTTTSSNVSVTVNIPTFITSGDIASFEESGQFANKGLIVVDINTNLIMQSATQITVSGAEGTRNGTYPIIRISGSSTTYIHLGVDKGGSGWFQLPAAPGARFRLS